MTAKTAPIAPRALTPVAKAPEAGAEATGETVAAGEVTDFAAVAEPDGAVMGTTFEEAGGWATALPPGAWEFWSV